MIHVFIGTKARQIKTAPLMWAMENVPAGQGPSWW